MMTRRELLLTSAVSLASGAFAMPAEGERIALVIGCGNYLFTTKLSNTLNDARDVKAALTKLGYSVTHLEDPSLSQLRLTIDEFLTKAEKAKDRVIYYSGHGIQVNGVNYLLPVTCQLKDLKDLPDQGIPLSRLVRGLPEQGVNVVILDACRNYPQAKSLKSADGPDIKSGFAVQERPAGTLIAYATKPGDVASDQSPNNRNGLYTWALLQNLSTPGLTAEQVLKKTRATVMAASKNAQQPWDESSLTTEFAFSGESAGTPTTPSDSNTSKIIRFDSMNTIKKYMPGNANDWDSADGPFRLIPSTDNVWIQNRRFRNCRIAFQFMLLNEKSNSGIFLRCLQTTGKNATEMGGYEIQILNDNNYPGTPATGLTGALQGIYPPHRRFPFKSSGWNTMVITANEAECVISGNGQEILRYNGLERHDGSIGFQKHNGSVAFRNILITEL